MSTFNISTGDFEKLYDALENVADNLSKEIGVCLWKTATAVKRQIANEVSKELAVPKRAIKDVLGEKRDYDALVATVVVSETARIPVKDFKAYQTKAGVSTRISKKRGRQIMPGAFIIEKYGGHVFKRANGERRKLAKGYLKGPTVLGSFVHSPGLSDRVVKGGMDELVYHIEERVRYLRLRAAGGLNWQQPEYVSDQATGEN